MRDRDAHLSDEELLLAADGELSTARAAEIREHAAACWTCRVRLGDIESAVAAFVMAYHKQADPLLPAGAAPRARLRMQLSELSQAHPDGRTAWFRLFPAGIVGWRTAVAGALTLACALVLLHVNQHRGQHRARAVYAPSPRLTPGLARAMDRDQVCRAELPKNQVVTAEMRRRVFEVYGIANADPQAYEVDYLITPALGGADDIRNLWPQSYGSTAWNARVKDDLEDRLRDMVCRGELDLAEAQRDISTDWIAAYKKYFQTDVPPPAR
jgi:anti-sigma factor RsiW